MKAEGRVQKGRFRVLGFELGGTVRGGRIAGEQGGRSAPRSSRVPSVRYESSQDGNLWQKTGRDFFPGFQFRPTRARLACAAPQVRRNVVRQLWVRAAEAPAGEAIDCAIDCAINWSSVPNWPLLAHPPIRWGVAQVLPNALLLRLLRRIWRTRHLHC